MTKSLNSQKKTLTTIEIRLLAANYIKTLYDIGLVQQMSSDPLIDQEKLQQALKRVKLHDFSIWINKQAGFKNAKDSLILKKLIPNNESEILSLRQGLATVVLEYACANGVAYLLNSSLIKKIHVPAKKIKSIQACAQKLNEKLIKIDGFAFRCQAKQHFLQYLLQDLLTDPSESVFNSGKTHPQIIRELFGKNLMRSLIAFFISTDQKPSFYADLIIQITPMLFPQEKEAMDRSDWISHAKFIQDAVIEEMAFLGKTTKEYMQEYYLRSNHPQIL